MNLIKYFAFKNVVFVLICLPFFINNVFATTKELNLYIGANYLADTTVASLEKECNCRVQQNFFNDNEEMLAKVVAGAQGYNVIVATSYAVEELAHMGKVLPLDKSRLPNLRYIGKDFLNKSYDPNNNYSVPYAYTPVFLAYNQDKMKQLGIIPNTWGVIFDPKYLKLLKGRITVFNSARNVFAAALLYLGKDPNTTNMNDLKAAKNLIARASNYWAKYDSDSYYRALLRGDIWVSMSYSTDIFKTIQDAKLSKAKVKIDAMLQKEGNMYELDSMVIPKFSPDINLSYMFIEKALAPQSAYDLANMTGSSIPNKNALDKLDKSLTSIDWIYPKDSSKQYVFKAYPPSVRVMVNEMWTELKMQCSYSY